MTFLERVRGRNVVGLFVNGIKNPRSDYFDLDTFGRIKKDEYGDLIFGGCIATQMIMEVMGLSSKDLIEIANYKTGMFEWAGVDKEIPAFLQAVEYLQHGWINGEYKSYNNEARRLGLEEIDEPEWWEGYRFRINSKSMDENLAYYERLLEENLVTV